MPIEGEQVRICQISDERLGRVEKRKLDFIEDFCILIYFKRDCDLFKQSRIFEKSDAYLPSWKFQRLDRKKQ